MKGRYKYVQELNICFDYISLVSPMINSDNIYEKPTDNDLTRIVNTIKAFCDFDSNDIFKEEYSRFGYKDMLKMGENINLYFYGPVDKNGNWTWRFEATGQGCRDLEDRGVDLRELLIYFRQEFQSRATRIDIAIDDFKGNCSFDWLLNKLEGGYYLSSFRGEYERMGTKSKGYSIQFGGRTSTRTLLIYQKNLERENKGYHLNINYWTRFEMRFLKERANDLYLFILSKEFDMNISSKGFLYEMLDIKIRECDRGNEKNSILTDRKWLDFLDHVEKCKIVNQSKLESNLLSSKHWYKRSITKLDALLTLCDDNLDEEDMINYLEFKKENVELLFEEEKFKQKDLVRVNSYRMKLGLPKFESILELKKHFIIKMDNTIKKLKGEN